MQNRATFESCCAERGGKVSLAGLQRGGDGAGKTFMQFHLLKKFHLIERNGKIESSLFGECAAAVFKHSPLSKTCSPARYAPGFSPTWKHFSECAPPQQISWAGRINIPIRGPAVSLKYILTSPFPFLNYPFTK